jgi:DNA-binding transcriptional MerR regulator
MLANVFAKLIPSITKLIALFKNPASFVTDIIAEKLGESVSFLNKETLKSFKEGLNKSIDINNTDDLSEKKQKIRDLRKFFKQSPLSNYVFVKDDGLPSSILDGSALIPFGIFGLDLPFGMRLDLGELINKKPPLKLIFDRDLSLKNMKNLQKELNLRKFDNKQFNLNPKVNDNPKISADYQVRFEDGTEKTVRSDSFNQFVIDNSKRYNFIYLDESIGRNIKKIDELLETGSQDNLQKAKELLDRAKKEKPNDATLLEKENLLKEKLDELKAGEQPLLKFVLGIVTLPIKIIAGIIEWILNFFKSLINPVTLPTKIIELVSFKWVMQFFTPKGILEIAGIRFKPEKKLEWAAQVNIPGPPIDILPRSLRLPEDIKTKGFLKKSIKSGEYLSPDDFKIADLSEFLNVGFHVKLPTYSALQYRQNLKLPGPLLSAPGGGGFLCLIEKIINAIIDFVWATLGIEAIIPPPHIKLCDQKNPTEAAKIKDNIGATQSLDGFYYEVQREDGTVVKLLNDDDLRKYIDDNLDLLYDFNF